MRYLLLLFALLVAGCDSTSNRPVDVSFDSISGGWTGRFTASDGLEYFLEINIQEQLSAVSGTGRLTAGSRELPFEITGSFNAPSVSWTFNLSNQPPISVVGTVNGALSQMTLRLVGSGFGGDEVLLIR
ncbi:MAG: hypothetical protein AAGI08_09450 [Bacteroidota bacterium]